MIPALSVNLEERAVPSQVHMIWVGGKPPFWVEASVERWRAVMPVRFWTDESVAGTPLSHLHAIGTRRGMDPRSLADMLRVYAVAWFGGWYFDVDLVPLRPLPETTGYILSDSGSKDRVASNGAFGFPAGHAFLADVRNRGAEQMERGVKNEHYIFGPRTFHAVWLKRPVPFEPTIDLKASQALRRAMAAGEALDLDELRSLHPYSRVTHIGPPQRKRT